MDTHLRPSELEEDRRERAPIDHFLRTLAATHDGASVGVILTGTGSDGTLGVTAIKRKNISAMLSRRVHEVHLREGLTGVNSRRTRDETLPWLVPLDSEHADLLRRGAKALRADNGLRPTADIQRHLSSLLPRRTRRA